MTTTTISVGETTLERFNRIKRDWAHEAGHNNYSADTYLTILMDLAENHETDEPGGLPDDVREQLDRIEAATETIEQRTGSIDRTLSELGGGR